MITQKIRFASLLGILFLNTSFAATTPNWIQAENMLSITDAITTMTPYHDRVYIAGNDLGNLQPNNCTFMFVSQSFNDWLSVNNGLQSPTTCVQDLHNFVVFNDQLYAGGLSGFFVYNGNDLNPNWTSLSVTGLPTFMPTITNMVVYQNKIYAIATSGDGSNTGVYVFNAETKTWTNISSMMPIQENVAGPPTSLIVFNNKLYWTYNFVNGMYGPYSATMYVYNGDDTAPNWSTIFKSDDNREFVGMDVFNNTLLVAGNTNVGGTLTPQAFILAYNGDDKMPQWNDITGFDGTLKNLNLSAFSHSSTALFIGGLDSTTSRSSIYQFNGNFQKPSWVESDAGIKRYVGPGYGSGILNFTNTSHGFYAADFAVSGRGGTSSSVVYLLENNMSQKKTS